MKTFFDMHLLTLVFPLRFGKHHSELIKGCKCWLNSIFLERVDRNSFEFHTLSKLGTRQFGLCALY